MGKEVNLGTHISKFYKSFSGTDTLAFIMMPGSSPVVIGSLTTISYSMYRNKRPVINIGRTNINGVTRGSRIFAGTMVFTLINQHWLKELQDQLDWLKDYDELKVDELPLFDIMVISANEYGNAASMYIYGIDFTDEAQTISVEDLFTENVFSFVARDVSVFKHLDIKKTYTKKKSRTQKESQNEGHLYILDTSAATLDEVEEETHKQTLNNIVNNEQKKKDQVLGRNLYQSSSHTMMGNDVAEIQEILAKYYDVDINGVFDNKTDAAVRNYQSSHGFDVNGVVDDKLYNALKNDIVEVGQHIGLVVNKYGAFVYSEPNLNANIIGTEPYREQVLIYDTTSTDDNNIFQRWYKISTGYVVEEDIYSSYYTGGVIEFPITKFNDSNAYVTLIQSSLSVIYPNFDNITGVYDIETQNAVKQLQIDNGLEPTGIVDYNTWLLLQSLSGNVVNQVSHDNFKIELQTLPGVYTITDAEVFEKIPMFSVKLSCDNYINVKISVICYYDDDKFQTLTKTITIKEEQTVSLNDFSNAFVYNPKYGKCPNQVDYVIYPYNKKPYKWTIMYK